VVVLVGEHDAQFLLRQQIDRARRGVDARAQEPAQKAGGSRRRSPERRMDP
jgi:hypothetical protein